MATFGTKETRRRQKKSKQKKNKKTQHKLCWISLSANKQINVNKLPTNNWGNRGTEHGDGHHNTELRN